LEELKKARIRFEENEPRDLFYHAATELADLAIRGVPHLTLAEAVSDIRLEVQAIESK